jgi:hypothetical protein
MDYITIYCEVLHLDTQTVWAFDHEVFEGTDEWELFQFDPNTTSAIFVRIYNQNPQDEATT